MTLREHIEQRCVIVCAGSGGVGKTTVATALALAAARSGRRVLALTVDPSKRLAETMGVDRNLTVPVPVPAERLAEAGVAAGRLDAWMLDPRIVADDFVRRVTGSSTEADRLIANRDLPADEPDGRGHAGVHGDGGALHVPARGPLRPDRARHAAVAARARLPLRPRPRRVSS